MRRAVLAIALTAMWKPQRARRWESERGRRGRADRGRVERRRARRGGTRANRRRAARRRGGRRRRRTTRRRHGALVQCRSSDSVQRDATFSVADDFTLEAWILTSAPGSTSGTNFFDGPAVFHSDTSGTNNDFGSSILNKKFAFGTGNPDTAVISTSDVADGQWVHIAAVRVKSTGTVSVFVNGIQEARRRQALNTGPLNANPSMDIGANVLDARFFNGLIDEVRAWNIARTSAEIQAIDANAPPPATKPRPHRLLAIRRTAAASPTARLEQLTDPQQRPAGKRRRFGAAELGAIDRLPELATSHFATSSRRGVVATVRSEDARTPRRRRVS